jgi:hypothetical protein
MTDDKKTDTLVQDYADAKGINLERLKKLSQKADDAISKVMIQEEANNAEAMAAISLVLGERFMFAVNEFVQSADDPKDMWKKLDDAGDKVQVLLLRLSLEENRLTLAVPYGVFKYLIALFADLAGESNEKN